MRKALVLAMVLVMALATGAMAAAEVGGVFKATAEIDSFKFFEDEFSVDPTLSLYLTVKDETEEALNWDLEIELLLENSANDEDSANDENSANDLGEYKLHLDLGEYKLHLNDDYFKAWVWGNGYYLSDKNTYFSMILAGATASGIRGRLQVPVLDLATITVDAQPGDNLRAFVDAKVGDVDLGLAYARKNWTDEDEIANVIVGQAGYTVPAGDLEVRLQGAAGVTLGDNLGYAVGVQATSQVSEQLHLDGSITYANDLWKGDGTSVVPDNVKIGTTATYNNKLRIQASGSVVVKGEGNSIGLTGIYRMSETLAWTQLFHNSHWFKNDAPAFRAQLNFKDGGFGNARADVTAPVVEDLVKVWAYANYTGGKNVEADARARITPIAKLAITPGVNFKLAEAEVGGENGEEKELTTTTELRLGASYKIGASDTATLSLDATHNFATKANGLTVAIEVEF